MTQLEDARKGKITAEIRRVADAEDVSPETIRARVAAGHVVIPVNRKRAAALLAVRGKGGVSGVGEGLRVKVNANIGTSHDYSDVKVELKKLKAAVDAGADTVMDLSTGGDIKAIRKKVLAASPVPIGTVPIYETLVRCAISGRKGIRGLSADDILNAVREHCEMGVDFVTLHCGVTRAVVEDLKRNPRVCGIVSRGGTFTAAWMALHNQENPLFARYDEVLEICRQHDVTISLGDGMRPGALADSFDQAQVHELEVMATLAERARQAGVQVMIEGPGHVPLDQVPAQVRLQKALCKGAPFYVLGPLVTDIAPGYDHITSAIGGAVAAAAGADFLCYVTPTEHLGLPAVEHVREGVIAARIAAHAGDIARGNAAAIKADAEFSALRRDRNWEGQLARCIDPIRAQALRKARQPHDKTVCSMCGEYCVFKLVDDLGIATSNPPKRK